MIQRFGRVFLVVGVVLLAIAAFGLLGMVLFAIGPPAP